MSSRQVNRLLAVRKEQEGKEQEGKETDSSEESSSEGGLGTTGAAKRSVFTEAAALLDDRSEISESESSESEEADGHREGSPLEESLLARAEPDALTKNHSEVKVDADDDRIPSDTSVSGRSGDGSVSAASGELPHSNPSQVSAARKPRRCVRKSKSNRGQRRAGQAPGEVHSADEASAREGRGSSGSLSEIVDVSPDSDSGQGQAGQPVISRPSHECPLLCDRMGFNVSQVIEGALPEEGPQRGGRRLGAVPRGAVPASALLKRYWLLPSAVGDQWPKVPKEDCFLMEIVEEGPTDFLELGTRFTFLEGEGSLAARQELINLVGQGFGDQAIPEMLRRKPFHLVANFILAMLFHQQDRTEEAMQALRTCLHTLQCSFHPKFNPFVLDPNSLRPQAVIAVDNASRALFIAVLLLYVHGLTKFGVHETALEVCKLLFNLDPERDPAHALFHMDYYCVRLKRIALLEELSKSLFPGQVHLDQAFTVQCQLGLFLPNFAFSSAIARFRRCGDPPKVAFFHSPSHPEIAPNRYCLFPTNTEGSGITQRGKCFCVSPDYWDTDPANDRKSYQLLLMRALVIFPSFLQLLLQHLNISGSTIPQGSRSQFPWHDLIFSPAFSFDDVAPSLRHREPKVFQLFANRFVKIFIFKSEKLLSSSSFLVSLHEVATLLHLQFTSDYQLAMPVANPSETALIGGGDGPADTPKSADSTGHKSKETCKATSSHDQCPTPNQSSTRLGSSSPEAAQSNLETTTQPIQYREAISEFRASWCKALVSFAHEVHFNEKYADILVEEFKHPAELPVEITYSLFGISDVLGRQEFGLGTTFRPPGVWLSLRSSPFVLYFQALIPYCKIDFKGTRAVPITLNSLFYKCYVCVRYFCQSLCAKRHPK